MSSTTTYKLSDLLHDKVLTEGRKEDVMAKYPNVDKKVVDQLSQQDPSGNNKYLEWMVKQVDNGARPDRILAAVAQYHSQLGMLTPVNIEAYATEHGRQWDTAVLEKFKKQPKDINSIPSVGHLEHISNFLGSITTRKKEKQQLNKETDRIYEDDNLLVVSPRTHNASCQHGRHSAWCVATANTGHFANYTKNGVLYFFISKKDHAYTRYWSDKDNGQPPYKTALLIKDNGERSWWSKGDSNYTNGWVGDPLLPFLTPEIAEKVMSHNKFTIANRKQREIERVLISKGFYKRNGGDNSSKNDFGGFVRSKIYKPEQLVSIIRNDNWLALYENSEVGKAVREQLGADVVFSLFRELITTQPNIIETLKDIHSQEFLTNFSKDLSEEQNREIAGIIVSKLGKKPTAAEVGGDVKMYVDKWTMTPEEWQKYENSTTYFFIGKDGNIENLVKGDRFNPKDHHALQMMMLRAKMNQSGLYALVTDRGLLDQYVGVSPSEIPPDVLQTIMGKAKKLG